MAAPALQPSASRNQLIDAFRGVAIISVLIFHYTVRWAPPMEPTNLYGYDFSFPHWLQIGAYGVHLFFVISGLVITMTLLRSANAIEFVARRAARIYPAFATAVILTFLVTQFGPVQLRVSAMDLLANFAINAHFFGFKPVDGVYWTLAVELKFYAIVAVARWTCRDNYWIAILATSAFAGVMTFVHEGLSVTLLAPYWPFFLAGIGAWLWVFEHQRAQAVLFASMSAVLYFVSYRSNHQMDIPNLLVDLYVLCSAGIMILGLRFAPSARVPILAPIGRVSYSLYLLHQNIGVCLIGWFTKAGMPDASAMALATSVVLALAVLLFNVVEQPGNKALMRAYYAVARMPRRLAKAVS